MKNNTRKVVIGTLAISLIAALGIGGTLAFLTDSEQVTNHFSMGDLDITIDEPSWNDGTKESNPHDPSEPSNPDGSNPTDPSNPDGTDPTDPSNPGGNDPTEPTNPPGDGDNLTPGDSRDKDPTITAVTGDSYMRVVMMIQNQDGTLITDQNRLDLILTTLRYAENDAIKEGTSYSLADIAAYPTVNSAFTLDEEKSSAGIYYYNYNGIFKSGSKAVLFSDAVIPTDWGNTEMHLLNKYQIVLQAQAIQSANFADANAAFDALDGEISKVDASVDKNYGVVGDDSDAEFVLAGRTIKS